MTDEQKRMKKIEADNFVTIMNKYVPRSETSFSILAFPTPEIGNDFEKIFEEMFEINILSDSYYKNIQQKMIDVLDKTDYVHIKGLNNKTDIKIKLQKLNNPEKESNFNNCGADINIPVGEVYTTPMLSGTNGTLHIDEIYLNNYKYIDLLLKFKDGYISEFSCKNFDNHSDNVSYIKDSLLYPFSTLPIGEFAIGTNTLAYALAKKYNIMDKLPILVIEKMGPHIAIGDTCYILEEDKPAFNEINKKEIISRDNEKSILRKTDKKNAYTYHHTDITIPYESIEFISAITEKAQFDIIRNGYFVLEGTEELNKPLYEIK
jgi:aminopeptidase